MARLELRPADAADVQTLAELVDAAYRHYVEPSHQGRGIGRALIESAEIEARRAGFGAIYLYTHEKMTENLAFYSRIGYAEYDRRRRGDARLVYLRKTLG